MWIDLEQYWSPVHIVFQHRLMFIIIFYFMRLLKVSFIFRVTPINFKVIIYRKPTRDCAACGSGDFLTKSLLS